MERSKLQLGRRVWNPGIGPGDQLERPRSADMAAGTLSTGCLRVDGNSYCEESEEASGATDQTASQSDLSCNQQHYEGLEKGQIRGGQEKVRPWSGERRLSCERSLVIG